MSFKFATSRNGIVLKKGYLYILFFVLLWVLSPTDVFADKGLSYEAQKVEAYTKHFYSKINFRGHERMQYKTFQFAMKGYLNLVEDGRLNNRRYFTICDFSWSSNRKRLWVLDMINKRVVYNSLVAHGARTGEEYAKYFSNRNGSHQSSMGFYVTMNTYSGSNGYSLRLQGVDGGYNNAAFKRDVVMHGAKYVSPQFARDHKRIGRSWGCPAVPVHLARPIISTIQNGAALFIYHPTETYLRRSYWINNRIARLPREADRLMLKKQPSQSNRARPKTVVHKPKPSSKVTAPKAKKKSKVVVQTLSSRKAKAKVRTEAVRKLKAPNKKTDPEVLDPNIKRIVVPKDQVTEQMKSKMDSKKPSVRFGSKADIKGKTSSDK